jgi:hypothetical protein
MFVARTGRAHDCSQDSYFHFDHDSLKYIIIDHRVHTEGDAARDVSLGYIWQSVENVQSQVRAVL